MGLIYGNSIFSFLLMLKNIGHIHQRGNTFKSICHDALSACRSSTCIDLRPGLVVGFFFLFLAGRTVAQIELDWTDRLNAT